MLSYDLIIAVLWAALLAYWLISSFNAKRNVGGNLGWLAWRVLFVVAFLLATHLPGFTRLGKRHLLASTGTPLIGGLGVLLCVVGVALAIWARVHLGRNWGMPMSVKEQPELITSGPYSRIRHPIYTGFLLAMLGTVFIVGKWWFLVLAWFGPYFIYSAIKEEKLMIQQFPTQYPDYILRTKMLVPFLF